MCWCSICLFTFRLLVRLCTVSSLSLTPSITISKMQIHTTKPGETSFIKHSKMCRRATEMWAVLLRQTNRLRLSDEAAATFLNKKVKSLRKIKRFDLLRMPNYDLDSSYISNQVLFLKREDSHQASFMIHCRYAVRRDLLDLFISNSIPLRLLK